MVDFEQSGGTMDTSKPFWKRNWLSGVKYGDVELRDIPKELVAISVTVNT